MIPLLAVRRRPRVRLRWLALAFGVVLTGSVGAFGLYSVQRDRNTDRLLMAARDAAAAEHWSTAVNAYRQYLRRRPHAAVPHAEFADLALSRVNEAPDLIGDAVRTLQRLVQLRPTDPEPIRKLSLLYLDLREYVSAAGVTETWMQIAPESAEAVVRRAAALHGMRKDDLAAGLLQSAIAKSPGEPSFYPPLIEILEQALKRHAEAESWLHQALQAAPDAYAVHMAGFALHRFRGEDDAAEDFMHRAIELAPVEPDVIAPAALFLLAGDRPDEARALLRRAAESGVSDRRLLIAEAIWAARSRDSQAMSETAHRLMAFAGSVDLDLIAQAAELYLRSGNLERVDECIEILAAAPYGRSQAALYIDGLAGARAVFQGSPFAAIPRLERVLRKQSSSRWAMELLAHAYQNTGALDEAADLYRRVIILSPPANSARLALARIELQQGDCAGAADQLSALIGVTESEQRQAEILGIICAGGDSIRPPVPTETIEKLTAFLAQPIEEEIDAALLARALLQAGRIQDAQTFTLQWIDQHPGATIVTAELHEALLAGGHLQEAESWARRLIERLPRSPDGHELLIRVFGQSDRMLEARSHVELLEGVDELKGQMWATLAELYSSARQPREALNAWRSAATLLVDDVAVRRAIVRTTESAKEAEETLDQIARVEGEGGTYAAYERAWRLLNDGESKEPSSKAIPLLQRCLSARPGWVSARLLLAYAQEQTGRLEDAAESYRTARAQRPELAADAGSVRFVDLLKRLGRFDEADQALDRLVAAIPDSPNVLRLKLDREMRLRDVTSAADTAEVLLRLEGDDPAWAAVAADLHLRADEPAEAERIAEKALEKDPEAASLLWSLARALAAQNRAERAVVRLTEQAELSATATPHLILARLFLQLGRPQDADQSIQQALARQPDNAGVHVAAADYWGLRGDRTRQLQHARRAVTLANEAEDRSLPLAALLASGSSRTERAEARRILQKRLSENPRDTSSILLEAHLLATDRPPRLEEAESLARQALVIDSRSTQAYKMLASICARTGRVRDASDAIASALLFAPDDPDLLLTQAEIETNRGEPTQAFLALRKLLQIRPRLPEALNLLVTAYQQAGRVTQGIHELEQLCPHKTRTPHEKVLLARLVTAKPDPARAEALLREALASDPTNLAFREMVQFLAGASRFDEIRSLAEDRIRTADDPESIIVAGEALACRADGPELRRLGSEWLERVRQQHPAHAADAVFRMGLCLHQRADLVNAETMFLKAAALSPDASRPVNALAWLYSEDLGQPARAIELLDGFMAEGGQPDAEMLDTYAAASIRLGRHDVARRHAQQALARAGQTPTVTAASYRLGVALMQSGKPQDGLDNIRQALEMDARLGGLTPRERQEARRLLESAASPVGAS